ncbi:GntR family transcriptional regulator [Erysipelothrix sp. HDW6C]|uniref:GntR family transcriptional regulator n=1 Tax=Erysipelothrix sp. HDW6C TaxID=2714930 RepID=UPI0014075C73|nr:GntR family transcriptional regulator [Erysipelothrix sp. HDW6C]QIK70519.1 GntR family transcriptional regulator [Erysipelothrix sp. HDW6C]
MTHKYQSISLEIEQKIMNGHYNNTGNKLPTEEDLVNEYGVSRNTIRKAIDTLVKKGFIMPVQGSGMFIRDVSMKNSNAINLENFRGLTADYQYSKIETKLLEFQEVKATKKIAEIMQCNVGDDLYFINRLRIIDGKKWVVEYSYYNKQYIPFLNKEIINNSIYNYIQQALKKQIGYVDRIIEAGPLNEKDAKLLGLEVGDPALISTNKSMFKSGEIFDYSIDVHNYKYTKFLKLSNLL